MLGWSVVVLYGSFCTKPVGPSSPKRESFNVASSYLTMAIVWPTIGLLSLVERGSNAHYINNIALIERS